MKFFPFFVALAIMWGTKGERLTFTMSNASLPFGRSSIAAIHDGKDSIFLFGGHYPFVDSFTEILKYTISTDEIQLVGHLPEPYGTIQNTISMNSDGKIHIFNGPSGIYEFDPVTNIVRNVSSFYLFNTPFAQVSQDKALLFKNSADNGPRSVFAVDLQTMNANEIYKGPRDDIVLTTAAFDDENKTVYCPGVHINNNSHAYIGKFDIVGNEFDLIPLNFLGERDPSGAIWENGKVYIVVGSEIGALIDGIIVFDPLTMSYEYPTVEGINSSEIPTAQGVAYVKKLKRIYVFGGYSEATHSVWDSIGYFQIDSVPVLRVPPNKPTINLLTVNCSKKKDGLFPYSENPSFYFRCRDGEMKIFKCQASLYFDPLLLTCKHREEVLWQPSCLEGGDRDLTHPKLPE